MRKALLAAMIGLIALVLVLFNLCKEQPALETPNPEQYRVKLPMPVHEVVGGEWLIKIARSHGVDAKELYNLNKNIIGSDWNLIHPKQRLLLPRQRDGKCQTLKSGKGVPAAKIESGKLREIKPKKAATVPVPPFDWGKYAGYKVKIGEEWYTQVINPGGEPWRWQVINGAPYTIKGDVIWAIENFENLDREAKEILKKKFETGEKIDFQLPKGMYLNELWFRYQKPTRRSDVIAEFEKVVINGSLVNLPHENITCDLYSVEVGERIYCLVIPWYCHNPGWFVVEKRKPPEFVPRIPTTPPRQEVKPLMLVTYVPIPLLPIPVEEEETEQLEITYSFPTPKFPKPCSYCLPKDEFWFWGGLYINLQATEDINEFHGFNYSLFPCGIPTPYGELLIGPSVQMGGWSGRAGNAVRFWGNEELFGAEAQLRDDYRKTQLKVLPGNKEGWVEGMGFPYKSHDYANETVVYGAHTWWNNLEEDGPWFFQKEVGFQFSFASRNGKDSYMNGEKFDDPARPQHSYSVRGKIETYHWETAAHTIEANTGHRGFDHALWLEIRTGMKYFPNDWISVEGGLGFSLIEFRRNNPGLVYGMARLPVLEAIYWAIDKIWPPEKPKMIKGYEPNTGPFIPLER